MTTALAQDVVIIDAGGANLGSVRAAFTRLGVEPEVSRDPVRIAAASKLVLPGVGAAAPVMRNLRDNGIDELLRGSTTPLLGICIGMQVLFERSEEGNVAGLGLLPGEVRKLPTTPGVRLPHMGWNRLEKCVDSPLLDGIDDGEQVYFVHSYGVPPGADCIATTTHGQPISAIVQRGNRCGAQFHPERSSTAGAQLLSNFLRWSP